MPSKTSSGSLVTIIIPLYNLEGYIRAAVESAAVQTYGNIEILVINDGSTDGGPAIVREMAGSDSRIRIIDTPNQGLALTRKVGWGSAAGEFITYVDADDTLEPELIERCMAEVQNGDYDIVTCDYRRVTPSYSAVQRQGVSRDMTGFQFLENTLTHRIMVNSWGKLYRKSLMDGVDAYRELRLGQDSSENIQVGIKSPKVKFIDYVGVDYLQRPGSANHRKYGFDYFVMFCSVIERILESHRDVLGDRVEFYALLNKMRWLIVYVKKSSAPWKGDSEFARNVFRLMKKYKEEVEKFYSSGDLFLLRVYRHKILRPTGYMAALFMRWRLSARRRREKA